MLELKEDTIVIDANEEIACVVCGEGTLTEITCLEILSIYSECDYCGSEIQNKDQMIRSKELVKVTDS